jgi:hypothetical protein
VIGRVSSFHNVLEVLSAELLSPIDVYRSRISAIVQYNGSVADRHRSRLSSCVLTLRTAVHSKTKRRMRAPHCLRDTCSCGISHLLTTGSRLCSVLSTPAPEVSRARQELSPSMPCDTGRRQESETVSEGISKSMVVIPCLECLIDLRMKFPGKGLASNCRKVWDVVGSWNAIFLQQGRG